MDGLPLVLAIEAHVASPDNEDSYASISVRAGYPRNYVNKLRKAVAEDPDHRIDTSTLEKLAGAIGLEVTLTPKGVLRQGLAAGRPRHPRAAWARACGRWIVKRACPRSAPPASWWRRLWHRDIARRLEVRHVRHLLRNTYPWAHWSDRQTIAEAEQRVHETTGAAFVEALDHLNALHDRLRMARRAEVDAAVLRRMACAEGTS